MENQAEKGRVMDMALILINSLFGLVVVLGTCILRGIREDMRSLLAGQRETNGSIRELKVWKNEHVKHVDDRFENTHEDIVEVKKSVLSIEATCKDRLMQALKADPKKIL